MPEDWQKRHPWGDARTRPEDVAPENEEEAVGPEGPSSDIAVRALSVVPFLLLAVFGLIGIVSWFFVFLFGAGPGEPVWVAVRGLSALQLLRQVVLTVLLGLAPLAVVLLSSWATSYGFRSGSGKTFWGIALGMWAAATAAFVIIWTGRRDLVAHLGFGAFDWWFAFSVVAFAMIIAGVRLRRAPRTKTKGT